MPQRPPLILKTPLYKKYLLIITGIVFGSSAFLLFQDGSYIVGFIILLLFWGGAIILLLRDRTVLVVDSEGVVFRTEQKIPWEEISDISIVSQRVRYGVQRYIGISLKSPETYRDSKYINALSGVANNLLEGKPSVQFYIASHELPSGSLETHLANILSFRPTAPETAVIVS